MASAPSDVTQALADLADGDTRIADRLLPLVYAELRDLAAGFLAQERPGHTLQPTALVHEAYLRLVDQTRVNWQGRAHFFAVAATAIRRVLVDHARKRGAAKRGGNRERITLEAAGQFSGDQGEDVEAIDGALNRLAELDERKARVVELRFFGGLSIAETAEVIGTSDATVERDWSFARAWLFRELHGPNGG